MTRMRTLSAVALCASMAIGRMQDPGANPVPKDAPALLELASAAVLATPVLAVHCKYVQKTGDKVLREAEADVVYRRGESGPELFYLKGKVSKPESFAFEAALVGENFIVVDTAKKTFESWPWASSDVDPEKPQSEFAKRSIGYEAVRGVFPMMEISTGLNVYAAGGATEKSAVLKGTETIGGVLCDVVEIRFTMEAISVDEPGMKMTIPPMTHVHRHAIGRADYIPRRYAWQLPSFLGSVSPETIHELTKLKTEAPAGADPALAMEGLKEGKVGSGKTATAASEGGMPGRGGPGGRPGGGSNVIIGPSVGDQAPDFTVKDTAGKEYSLEKLKGKYLLVHFGKLDNDLDDDLLVAFKKRHGDKLILLDLVVGGDAAEVKKAKKALSFPRCVGGADVATNWKLDIFPSVFFVGPDGKVAGKLPRGLRGEGAKPLLEDYQRRTAEWLKDPKKIIGE